jgi:GAF domain-containing protein
LCRLDGITQHLEVVESADPLTFHDGSTQPQSTSLCQAILTGQLPYVIPQVSALPAARCPLPAQFREVGSYLSVPVTFSDGRLYGTLGAAGWPGDPTPRPRDVVLLAVLAQAAASIVEPEVVDRERRNEIRGRVERVLSDGGPTVLLNPSSPSTPAFGRPRR